MTRFRQLRRVDLTAGPDYIKPLKRNSLRENWQDTVMGTWGVDRSFFDIKPWSDHSDREHTKSDRFRNTALPTQLKRKYRNAYHRKG